MSGILYMNIECGCGRRHTILCGQVSRCDCDCGMSHSLADPMAPKRPDENEEIKARERAFEQGRADAMKLGRDFNASYLRGFLFELEGLVDLEDGT